MAGNPRDRVVLTIDPDFPFEQVSILTSGESFDDQAVVRTNILLSQEVELIICRLDRAVAMRASGRGLGFTFDEPFEDQVTNQLRALFRFGDERLAIRGAVFNLDHL